ncbi:hypothetical protein C5167_032980 [Papaver somniferum]|uniref:Uncharacterized protein n=1 Tax=Papaver somniferum TaxID=3469 RepID=A0A4Y7KD08_PAPSO|nr:hypothetical protein C5167_032980 [Papaver somniferum]
MRWLYGFLNGESEDPTVRIYSSFTVFCDLSMDAKQRSVVKCLTRLLMVGIQYRLMVPG